MQESGKQKLFEKPERLELIFFTEQRESSNVPFEGKVQILLLKFIAAIIMVIN